MSKRNGKRQHADKRHMSERDWDETVMKACRHLRKKMPTAVDSEHYAHGLVMELAHHICECADDPEGMVKPMMKTLRKEIEEWARCN